MANNEIKTVKFNYTVQVYTFVRKSLSTNQVNQFGNSLVLSHCKIINMIILILLTEKLLKIISYCSNKL